jgi:hypothetical protein
MTYARQRLWLGITAVGSTVLIAIAAVVFDLPHRFISPLADQTFNSALSAIALVWMLHAAMLVPFDIVGGLLVVRERPRLLHWLASWLRAIVAQWIWFALSTALLLRTGQQFGVMYALIVFLLLQLVLVSRQGLIAWLAGGIRVRNVSTELAAAAIAVGVEPRAVREVKADDPAFVGVWVGADARQLWVPQRWVRDLSAEQLSVALARRAGVRALGLRRRGLLAAMAWNSIGFTLATSLPHADLVTAAGFVTVFRDRPCLPLIDGRTVRTKARQSRAPLRCSISCRMTKPIVRQQSRRFSIRCHRGMCGCAHSRQTRARPTPLPSPPAHGTQRA